MESSHVVQLVHLPWGMPRQLEQDFVPDDPISGHVSTFRFPFSPSRELTKNRGRFGFELIPSAYALIPLLRLAPSLADGALKTRELFVYPLQSAELRQPSV